MSSSYYDPAVVCRAASPAHLFFLGRARGLPPSLDPAFEDAPLEADGYFSRAEAAPNGFFWWTSGYDQALATVEPDAVLVWAADGTPQRIEPLRVEVRECFRAFGMDVPEIPTARGTALAPIHLEGKVTYHRPDGARMTRLVGILPRQAEPSYTPDLIAQAISPAHLFFLGHQATLPPDGLPADGPAGPRKGESGRFYRGVVAGNDCAWWISGYGDVDWMMGDSVHVAVIETDYVCLWFRAGSAVEDPRQDPLRRLALQCLGAFGLDCDEEETPFGTALMASNHPPYRFLRPRVLEKKSHLVAVLPRK